MARYYFDVTNRDGKTIDDTGEEFSALEEVEKHVGLILADVLRDDLALVNRGQVTVRARDESGTAVYAGSLLFTVKRLGDD